MRLGRRAVFSDRSLERVAHHILERVSSRRSGDRASNIPRAGRPAAARRPGPRTHSLSEALIRDDRDGGHRFDDATDRGRQRGLEVAGGRRTLRCREA